MMREEKGGRGGKKKRTSIDRSINRRRRNGRDIQLGQIDLERLVTNVALHFGDIRRNLNSNVRDGVDGGVRRVS